MRVYLEQQVRELDIPMPEGFIARVLENAIAPAPARPRSRGGKLLAGLAIGSLFVGANVAAAQYVPLYDDALRHLPFAQPGDVDRIRTAAGIPSDDVVPSGSTLRVGNFEVTAVGTYADGYRTTVLLVVAPDPGTVISNDEIPFHRGTIHLKDAAGRIYEHTGGAGSSTIALNFEPLVAGAAQRGRITVVIFKLETDLGAGYRGMWELELSYELQDAPSLPVPQSPLVAGDTRYNIVSIVDSGFRLIIEWEAAGGAVERLAEFRRQNPPATWHEDSGFDSFVHQDELLRFSLWPYVFDSNGNRVWGSRAGDGEIIDGVYHGFQEIELPAPGEYTIRFCQVTEAGADCSSSDPGWPILIDG
jgi:hypothetical protein